MAFSFLRFVHSREFVVKLDTYVCTVPTKSQIIRVVDDNGTFSNEVRIDAIVRPALVWGGDKSIAIGGSVLINVSGGKIPYRYSINGAGFWLDPDYTKKSLITYRTSITVYNDGNYDNAEVIVRDDCDQSVVGDISLI